MERVENGLYHFKFSSCFSRSNIENKFTRVDWSEVEIDKYGNRTENTLQSVKTVCKKRAYTNGEKLASFKNQFSAEK
jgi:hypothetical protein